MPVTKDKKTGKWRIGSGKPIYDTKKDAERAYRGYLWSKYGKKTKKSNKT